jgi:hypothetical protein
MKIKQFFVVMFAGLFLVGCSEIGTNPEFQSEHEDPTLTRLLQMGFAMEDIIDSGDYYIVEKDMIFTKSDNKLLEKSSQTVIRSREGIWPYRYWEYHVITNGREEDITVCLEIDSRLIDEEHTYSEWRDFLVTRIEHAMDWWNSANSAVYLHWWTDQTCDTKIVYQEGYSNHHAHVPEDGKPGGRIDIFEGNPTNEWRVFTHEMGHILGLGHTDIHDDGNQYIGGTKPYDGKSIMISTGDVITSTTIPSPGDLQALKLLYPRRGDRKRRMHYSDIFTMYSVIIEPDGVYSEEAYQPYQVVLSNWTPWPGYQIRDGADFLDGKFFQRNADNNPNSNGWGFVHIVPGTDYALIWRGKDDGSFFIYYFSPWEGYGMNFGSCYKAGDWDGDGLTDLVHLLNTYYAIWMNNGNGTFTVTNHVPWSGYGVGYSEQQYLVIDVNSDGKDDMVHLYPAENVWYGREKTIMNSQGFNVVHENL